MADRARPAGRVDPYRPAVATRKESSRPTTSTAATTVDRAIWSRLLTEMMANAGTTNTITADLSGFNPRTIQKWVSQETEVEIRSVVKVARALGYEPTRALYEIGVLTADEAKVAGAGRPLIDPLARAVNLWLTNPRIPTAVRALIRHAVDTHLKGLINMYRAGAGPHEPTANARAAGARVEDRGDRG